ncbi:MAG: hypothetical protein ACXVFV_07555 [Mycobacteriales bacterium]
MELLGWNVVPRGYGVRFDLAAAPWPLRALFRTPLLDRFAHPLLVRRGHAYLAPHPAVPEAQREPVPDVGWRLESPGVIVPGSRCWLEPGER